jgi:hypothetical protein
MTCLYHIRNDFGPVSISRVGAGRDFSVDSLGNTSFDSFSVGHAKARPALHFFSLVDKHVGFMGLLRFAFPLFISILSRDLRIFVAKN